MDNTGLVRLTAADSKAALETIALAFYQDVLWHYMLPVQEPLYSRAVRSIMGFPVRYAIRYGEVYAPSPAMEGVAVWQTPTTPSFDLIRSLQSGLLEILALWVRLGRKHVRHLLDASKTVLEARVRNAPIPHYYLEIIGVRPDHQGKGVGSRLIAPMLVRADCENVPCYLETQTESNVAFYRKRGFAVVEALHMPHGGPQVWIGTGWHTPNCSEVRFSL